MVTIGRGVVTTGFGGGGVSLTGTFDIVLTGSLGVDVGVGIDVVVAMTCVVVATVCVVVATIDTGNGVDVATTGAVVATGVTGKEGITI